MASTNAVEDSEVGIVEGVANAAESHEDAPDADLLQELVPGEFGDIFEDDSLPEIEAKPEAGSEEDAEDGEDEEPGDEDESESEDEDAEPEEEPAKPQSRSAKRIQKLLDQNKELQASLQQSQAQMRYQFATALKQQQEAHKAELAQMRAYLDRQAQVEQRRAAAEEEKGLTEVERFERKVLSAAEERVLGRVGPYIQQLEQRLAQREEAEAQRDAQAKSQARLEDYTAKARQAREKVLLAGIDAQFGNDEQAVFDDMLLAYVAAKDIPPEQAAASFRAAINKMHAAMVKGKTKTVKQAKGKSKVPPSTPGRRPAQEGVYRPSWEALMAAGYRTYIDWRADGGPKLKEPA